MSTKVLLSVQQKAKMKRLRAKVKRLQKQRLNIDRDILKTANSFTEISGKPIGKIVRRGPAKGSKKPKQKSLDKFIQSVMIPHEVMKPSIIAKLVKKAGYKTMGTRPDRGMCLSAQVGVRMKMDGLSSVIKHKDHGEYIYIPKLSKRRRAAKAS